MRSRGPRMGKRPKDFDEELVRQAPTFRKWLELEEGESLRYACRYFTKGHEDDEERLMRRIMIARRNNVKDHKILKSARSAMKERLQAMKEDCNNGSSSSTSKENAVFANNDMSTITKRKRALIENTVGPAVMSDLEVMEEMDVDAVEKTPSFQTWKGLMDGVVFTYSQSFTKGKIGHEWLLKKSIWRRMRYRRENKKLVTQMQNKIEDENVKRSGLRETSPSQSTSSTKDECNEKNINKNEITTKKHTGVKINGNIKDDSHHDEHKVSSSNETRNLLKRKKGNSLVIHL